MTEKSARYGIIPSFLSCWKPAGPEATLMSTIEFIYKISR
jgi:hypothetical protein